MARNFNTQNSTHSQNWRDDKVQVLETGKASNSNQNSMPPYNATPFQGTLTGEGGASPGQCLISISNYNFYNSADPRNIMPATLNLPNNFSFKGERNMPVLQNAQSWGRNLQNTSFGLIGHDNFQPRMRKRLRTIFTREQVNLLEAAYSYSKYPDAGVKKKIASKLNLPVDRVQVWFQNKRTRDQKISRQKSEGEKEPDVGKCAETTSPKTKIEKTE